MSLVHELIKLAAYGGNPTVHELKADAHFKMFKPNWKTFEKNLKGKKFQQAVIEHPDADEKIKRYAENYGAYVTSKDVMGKVQSRKGRHHYKIKRVSEDRLGCGCKDWQYRHSHAGGNCDHIKTFLSGKTKVANLGAAIGAGLRRGVSTATMMERNKELGLRGVLAKKNVDALRAGQHQFHPYWLKEDRPLVED
jgi:hypothetical protein